MCRGPAWPLRRTAERFQVSVTTAVRWTGRYRQLGAAGMVDRSIRPHRCPRQTSLVEEQEIPRDPLLGLQAPKLDTAVLEPLTTDRLKVPAPRVEVIEADRIEHDGTGRHPARLSAGAGADSR